MSTIKELSILFHKNAVEKEFWEEDWNMAEKLALIHSEISEALEADRKDRFFKGNINGVLGWASDEDFKIAYTHEVKGTFEEEMADAAIRIFDLCGKMRIDLEKHMLAKHRFNVMRQKKHGKKY